MKEPTVSRKFYDRFFNESTCKRRDAYADWWYSRSHPYGRKLRKQGFRKLFLKIMKLEG